MLRSKISGNIFSILVAATFICISIELQSCDSITSTNTPSPADTIRIITPNGGEVYHIGETIPFRWVATDTLFKSVVLQMTCTDLVPSILNDGAAIDRSSPNWGRYDWPIPDSLQTGSGDWIATPSSDSCLVEAYDYSLTEKHVFSEGTFSILPKATH